MTVQLRNTRQKDAIRGAFRAGDRPLSPDEVHRAACAQVPGISLATVYRNINALLEEGWLAAVELPGQAARYEVSGKAHHHHFQCTSCNRIYEMSGCGLEPRPRMPRGFKVTGHEFFLYGICAACA